MTNDQHYQPSFRAHELEPPVVLALVQDEELYDLYTDALVLLHDLISPQSSEAPNARFTPNEIDTQTESIRVQIREYMDAAEEFPLEASAVLDNLLDNYRLANQLRERAEAGEDRFEVERSATQFTNSVMQIYTALRTLSRFVSPTDFE